MRSLWRFLREKPNRDTVAVLAPVLVALVAGIWTVFAYVFPPGQPDEAKSEAARPVNAQSGGVAAGRDISGNTITIGTKPARPPQEQGSGNK